MNDYQPPDAAARRWPRSRIVRWCFGLGLAVVCGAGATATLLATLFGQPAGGTFRFPVAFVLSTLLLALGSLTLTGALRAVRRERQALLRRRLSTAIGIGALFIGTQLYALWTILPLERSLFAASAGVVPFAVMLATMHGLHFLVATLFVIHTRLQTEAGRYDHEYHWGITVCAWFWHGLGVVWLGILAVYSIVAW